MYKEASATVIVAAIGVGALIFYLLQKNQIDVTNENNEQQILRIQNKMKESKSQNSEKSKQRTLRKSLSNDSTYIPSDNDSTTTTDIGDEMFFDCYEDFDDELSLSILHRLDDMATCTEEQGQEKLYYELKTLISKHPHNVDILWRYGRACHGYANHISNTDQLNVIISEGISACKDILDSSNADVHKWYAILVGVSADRLPISTKEKIEASNTFKFHITKAISLRPTEALLHHLLGRMQYEVSGLSWFERNIAAALFSEPPNATYTDAIDSFKYAEELASQPHLENRLFLAKSYLALNNCEEGVYWLLETVKETALTEDDVKIQNEAHVLLASNKF